MRNLSKYFMLTFLVFLLLIILLIGKLSPFLLVTYLIIFLAGLVYVYIYIVKVGELDLEGKKQSLGTKLWHFVLMLISCFLIALSVFHVLNRFFQTLF